MFYCFHGRRFLSRKIVLGVKKRAPSQGIKSSMAREGALFLTDLSSEKRETRSYRVAGNRTKYRSAIFFENPRFSTALLRGEPDAVPRPPPLFNSRRDSGSNENSLDERSCFHLVGPPGIEPGLSAPKADVLPVYYGPKLRRECTCFAHAFPTKRGTMAAKQQSNPPLLKPGVQTFAIIKPVNFLWCRSTALQGILFLL